MGTHSRLTAQGQISVPAEVRRKLGVGPGAILEWQERDGEWIVRRAGRFTSGDVHAALFPGGRPPGAAPVDTGQGIRRYVRARHARR